MVTTRWKLPVPSTALLGSGVVLEKRQGRQVALGMRYESEGSEEALAVIFEGVEAFKMTYDGARDDSMLEAYDRLIGLGRTPWLVEVTENLRRHGENATGLHHLMIDFDDGPCYEVICRSHRIEPVPT